MDAMRERRQVGQSLLLQPSRSGRVAAAEAGRAGKRARARRAALSSASKAREMRIFQALKERRDAAIYSVFVRVLPYFRYKRDAQQSSDGDDNKREEAAHFPGRGEEEE